MKYVRYLWYVVRHKWYVLLASWKYGCLWRGIVHDLSKFYPSEFLAYADWFYGTKLLSRETFLEQGMRVLASGRCREDQKADFDLAWLLHQRRNPHHHQFWVQLKDDGTNWSSPAVPMEMPDIYVREMVADWEGAGRAIHGKIETLEWYEKNKDKMLLHSGTRLLVEILLGYPAMKKVDPMPPRVP